MAVAFVSCDEHRDFPDTAMKTCDILCTDGKVVRFEDMQSQGKKPIAVVFHINQTDNMEGTGFAVYLWDIASAEFSDSIGVKQTTSANVTAYDGNSNTYAMHASGVSPAADEVFNMWHYGQSAYIPSVAQMRLLYQAKNAVNSYIQRCGGDVISDNPDECWYWTSTECKGQQTDRAWCFSLYSGRFESADKHQEYATRPIMKIRLNKAEQQ